MATLNSWALTNVADVKESLGIDSGDSSWNNIITRKINQATDMIEGWCGLNNSQHFASTTYTNEEYSGAGNQLVLKRRPIITLSSFQARETSQNEDSWSSIESELYFANNTAGVIDLLFNTFSPWNRYRVTYTAGFATIPSDLAEACVILAGYLVDQAGNPTGTVVKRKSEGARSVEYQDVDQKSSDSLIEQLGLDDILSRYVDTPILADK